MTNVLFVTPDFYPKSTGFANASLNLIEAIKKNGKSEYNIYVFTHIPLGNSGEIDGIKVFRVPRHKTNKLNRLYYDYKKYRLIRNIVINNSIDVIFFETNTFPFVQNWILRDFPKKVFVRIHSTADTEVVVYGLHKWYQLEIKKRKIYSFMNRVPYIISTSSYYLDFIRHNYLHDNVYKVWDNKSYGLLYNTVNVSNTCEIPVMANKFLSMGKMSDNGLTQKGLLDLIRAVYYLKEQKKLPGDFELTIIGNGTQLPTVRAFINKLGLNNYIRIIEQVSHDEVLEKIADSKGIILLSRYEGQSMFITESIAMGKPIIISDKNGMQDVLAEDKNGYIVKTGDVIEAAEKIEKMMNLNKETLDSYGKMSREIYLNKFSDEKVFRQFDNIMKTRY